MKEKIIVVGANQGALAFAYMACKKGFDVSVFEKKKREDVSYIWTDDFSSTAFSDAGLPSPPSELLKRTRKLTFVAPSGALIPVNQPEESLDCCIKRRELNAWLEKEAVGAGAKIYYEKAVKCALIENQKVCGAVFENGKTERCSLLVDCGGIDSCVRKSLPSNFGIQKEVESENFFIVSRRLFNRAPGSDFPKNPKKIYLKHLGEAGISWCVLTQDEQHADVLIGRIGALSPETAERALSDLKKDNPIIGEGFLPGSEGVFKIPVRCTFSKIFAAGYALLGDSACMTIPMIGSGIASGFKSAKNLAETLCSCSSDPFSPENLYRYQLRYMKETGAFHAAIGLIKNALLETDTETVNKIIDSGIMRAIVLSSEGESGGVLKAVLSLAKANPKIFVGFLKLAALAARASLVCLTAPKNYSEESLEKWRQTYEKACGLN